MVLPVSWKLADFNPRSPHGERLDEEQAVELLR